jgi:phosphoribosyl 1,2-cyclic phosphodiesterase
MEFSILASGSAGNCAVVRCGSTTLLVDAGLSARQLVRRLESCGVDPESLDGVVLTHEHGDHTAGLDVFLRKRAIPVWCEIRTKSVLAGSVSAAVNWKLFENGDRFEIGGIEVSSFSIPHDAVEPLGFVFRGRDGARFGLVSDIGKPTNLVRHHLNGVDSVFVEANYDDLLLQNDTKRPWATKQRISGDHGHLSNAQAASLVVDIARDNLHRVVLGHLSRDCNQPGIAIRAVKEALRQAGRPDVFVECAGQAEPLPFYPVRRPGDDLVEEDLFLAPEPLDPRDHAGPPEPRIDWAPSPVWHARQPSLFDF